jgi:hypothetical protein
VKRLSNPEAVSYRDLAHAPNDAIDARAKAWLFVFDSYRKKKASFEEGPDDGTVVREDPANDRTIRQ